jgi:hypothetical protein
MTSKRRSIDELRDLSDAIDESILSASDAEVSEELALFGIDPEKVAAEMDALTQEAKRMAGRLRLARARDAVTNFRSNQTSATRPDRTALRAKLQKMRLGAVGDDSMTMAARKGKPLSTDDEEGAVDDLAQLEALESEDPEASKE